MSHKYLDGKIKEKSTINWEVCPFRQVCCTKGNSMFYYSLFLETLSSFRLQAYFLEKVPLVSSGFSQHRRKGMPKGRFSRETLGSQDEGMDGFSSLLILCLSRSMSLAHLLSCFWPYCTPGLMEMLCVPSANWDASVAFFHRYKSKRK